MKKDQKRDKRSRTLKVQDLEATGVKVKGGSAERTADARFSVDSGNEGQCEQS